ncbi:MAG TPA: hypothetical protein VFM93_00490, partial [Candidatus Limnocylindria bacterium]|nr:hypothetical protein [Candidatus Limnocylindria bacterium]
VAVAGPEGIARWPERIAYAAGETGRGEVSLPATARRFGLGALPALGLSVALTGIFAAALVRRPSLAAAPVLALLAAPHALLHDLVLAYPAIAVVATSARASWAWVIGGSAATLLQLIDVPAAVPYLAVLAVVTLRRAR